MPGIHPLYAMLLFQADMTQADLEYLLGDSDKQQHASALFLLKLKEQRRVSQVTIDDIVSGFEGLLQQCHEQKPV